MDLATESQFTCTTASLCTRGVAERRKTADMPSQLIRVSDSSPSTNQQAKNEELEARFDEHKRITDTIAFALVLIPACGHLLDGAEPGPTCKDQ